MLSFQEFLEEKCNCWKGYKRVPGTKPCAEDSCVKEETNLEEGEAPLKHHTARVSYHKEGDPHRRYEARFKTTHNGGKEETEKRAKEAFAAKKKIVYDIVHEQVENEELLEAAVDAKGHKSSTGGLTQKGRDAYNAKGANLQAPVTTPPSKLDPDSKAAKRRKSFCARMGGMEGSMKKPNGEPTRKALALKKWNC